MDNPRVFNMMTKYGESPGMVRCVEVTGAEWDGLPDSRREILCIRDPEGTMRSIAFVRVKVPA